jgi:hypothetical protein
VARKGPSKKDRCDICGTALDDDAVIQEFPDGSLVRLCEDCAQGAALDDEEEAEERFEADDATAEWADPLDDQPTAVDLFAVEPHGRSTRPAAENTKAGAEERFQAEVFDADLFHAEHAGPEEANGEFDGEEEPAAKAEAELAAWASAKPGEIEVEEQDVDFETDEEREAAHDAALELASTLVEEDMAAEMADTVPFQTISEAFAEDEEEAFEQFPPAAGEALAPTPLPAVLPPPLPRTQAVSPLEAAPEPPGSPSAEATPQSADEPAAAEPRVPDAVDKTKELLVPVTDLITLQGEMQSALSKLASTLEHFATEIVTSEDKTASLTNRLQQLEDELESTRERLRVAESVLAGPIAEAAEPTDTEAAAEPAAQATRGPEPAKEAAAAPPPLPGTPAPAQGNDKKGAAAVVPPSLPSPALPTAAVAPPPLPGAALPTAVAAPPPLPGKVPQTTPATGANGAALAVPPAPANAGATAPPPPAGAAPAAAPRLPTMPAAVKAAAEAVGAATAGAAAPVTGAPPLPVPPPVVVTPRAPTLPPAPTLPVAPAAGPPASPALGASPALAASPAAGPPASPTAAAAAAMHKLLRGRKGHHEAPPPEPVPVAKPETTGLSFRINEVQAAQRYFNESAFVKKIRDISRSIGKPQANVSRPAENEPQAFVTVLWDIVWYQYLVDLRRELPAGVERVVLEREGMDSAELEPRFREKNATVNDDGRVDASELEVGLLSDPNALITEMDDLTPEEARFQDDATEEIWDQQQAPEFRWD